MCWMPGLEAAILAGVVPGAIGLLALLVLISLGLAVARARLRGVSAPRAVRGMEAGCTTSRIRKTFWTAWSTGTLPATAVMACTEAAGDENARSRARASSMPGSVSIRSGI